jgi:hypothetical protein
MGLCGNGVIIGPIFYQGNLNGEQYLEYLTTEIVPQIREAYGDNFQSVWYMQDGAPCHRRRTVNDYLSEVFQRQVIGIGHDVEWPPRSPDLSLCDFYLWGDLKNKVFTTPPRNTQDLHQRINNEIMNLKTDQDLIRRVMQKMVVKLRRCLELGGRQVS